MPSYFGPTNIPPVEAWSLKVPVEYSSLNINHGKNAAVYFDPDSVNDLVKAILKLDTLKIRNKLIFNGIKRFKNIKKENKSGHKKFTSYVSRLIENSENSIN